MNKKEQLSKLEDYVKSKEFQKLPDFTKDIIIDYMKQESTKKFYTKISVLAAIVIILVIGLILYFTNNLSDTVVSSVCKVIVVVVIVIITKSTKEIKDIFEHFK